MQDLRVIGVENGALLVATEDGARFRIPIDEALRSKVRQSSPEPQGGRKVAPKEIQQHIRAGMSADDVASMTGASVEYIQKFERPVLAEREFVVTAALAVPVHTAQDTSPLDGGTFGQVIQERLGDLGAADIRWASWKDVESGWIVKLSFTADEIEHDARWQFDPKKSTLVPLGNEAIALSQQGELTGSLIPRLRAVGGEPRTPDTSRFDSGAFTDRDLEHQDTAPYVDPIPFTRASDPAVAAAAINRSPDASTAESGHTADLLEALRRRRGEREPAGYDELEEAKASHPSTGSIRVIDIPLDDFNGDDEADPSGPSTPSARDESRPTPVASIAKGGRKGRVSMPSWDDIVFGAKSDDD
ncbi:DUF3071 family protein [Homoserinimonas aerilata]|uniref:DUF3071 family protein n=1 Tax=Homoserinimonas aerilata TaxID=1162970 RepID=A0A542YIK4_9MICO|nr:septation protein SepH [Homoserinimonas aerilata]TQL47922.1 DUF3071 family protein [Homoserinimonas aerilata]